MPRSPPAFLGACSPDHLWCYLRAAWRNWTYWLIQWLVQEARRSLGQPPSWGQKTVGKCSTFSPYRALVEHSLRFSEYFQVDWALWPTEVMSSVFYPSTDFPSCLFHSPLCPHSCSTHTQAMFSGSRGIHTSQPCHLHNSGCTTFPTPCS